MKPGYAVVALHPKHGFMPLTNPATARGWLYDSLWIFGYPETSDDRALSEAVAPAIAMMSKEKVHYFNAIDGAWVPLPRSGSVTCPLCDSIIPCKNIRCSGTFGGSAEATAKCPKCRKDVLFGYVDNWFVKDTIAHLIPDHE